RDRDALEGRPARQTIPRGSRARRLRRSIPLPRIPRHLDHLVGGGVLQGVRNRLTRNVDPVSNILRSAATKDLRWHLSGGRSFASLRMTGKEESVHRAIGSSGERHEGGLVRGK